MFCYEPITLKRKELYELVWSEPLIKLSKKFGLSDNGLRKICKRHNIPVPGIGYWAKKAAGQQLKKIPLANASSEKTITINPSPSYPLRSDADSDCSQNLESDQNIPPIIVSKSLRDPHPLVSQSKEIIELCKPDDDGILVPKNKKCLDIRVSEKTLSRALRIFDALIKGLRDHGFTVSHEDGSTKVQIQDEWLGFGISEEIVSRTVPPKEINLDGSYQFSHSRFDRVRSPSGNLCLTIHDTGYFWAYNFRKTWRDTKRKQLEDSLDSFVAGLIKIVAQKKEYQRKQEEEEWLRREMARQREEQQKARAELERKIRQEQAHVNKLITDAENYKKSKLIRDFIAAVQNEQQKGKSVYVPAEAYNEWIEWARNQADRLDPLAVSPASIIDSATKEDGEDRNKW
jgi:hypothetical protein